jgi:hypothetical protein
MSAIADAETNSFRLVILLIVNERTCLIKQKLLTTHPYTDLGTNIHNFNHKKDKPSKIAKQLFQDVMGPMYYIIDSMQDKLRLLRFRQAAERWVAYVWKLDDISEDLQVGLEASTRFWNTRGVASKWFNVQDHKDVPMNIATRWALLNYIAFRFPVLPNTTDD